MVVVEQLVASGHALWVRTSTRPRRSAEEEVARLRDAVAAMERRMSELSLQLEDLRHAVHQKCGISAPTIQ